MAKRFANEMVFLAPRSTETSYDNLKSTIKNGISYSKVAPALDENGKQILSRFDNVYAWGNVDSKKGSWDLMNPGDLILFYSHGNYVFAARCLYKQHSEQLSDILWPRSSKNKNKLWACVFFCHDIRPIQIPIVQFNEIADYAMPFLRGFQSLKEDGLKRILERYGTLENFVSVFQTGASSDHLAKINHVTRNEDQSNSTLVLVDEVTRGRDLDELISEWKARNLNKKPEEIETRVKRLRRNVSLVKALKEQRGHKCQVCGFAIKMSNGNYYTEAAHVKPISSREKGVDIPENILILCPNHHKMLDYGAMTVLSDFEIQIDGKVQKLMPELTNV